MTDKRKALAEVAGLTDTFSDRLVELENTFTHDGDDPTFTQFHSLLGDIDRLAVDTWNDLEPDGNINWQKTTVASDGTATSLGATD